MNVIDINMKPELDEFGHPIHYVSKVSPGLHIGEYVENWAHYWKAENGTWDVEIYKTKYEDGHVREWPRKHVSDSELADAAVKAAETMVKESKPLDPDDQKILNDNISELT
jgi:hypothetical protein